MTALAVLVALNSGAPLRCIPASVQAAVPDEQIADTTSVLSNGPEISPWTLTFTGQARLRYEHTDGYTLKGYDPETSDDILLERVRLEFSARFRSAPLVFLQMQDAHAFLTRFRDSDFPRSNPIENALDIRQLFLDWKRIGGSPFGFTLGRMQISYGDQRVFGPGSWGNTGRLAWDAAILRIETEDVWTDVWVGRYLTYKTSVWPDRAVDNFSAIVAYACFRRLPVRVDLFYVKKEDRTGIVTGESGEGYVRSHSVGIQAESSPDRSLAGGLTLVAQRGEYGRDRIRAVGASGKLGMTFPLPWNPQAVAQITYGSGDRDPADGVHGTFDGVFGGRDIAFYGYLSLFFWANLWDRELSLSVRPRDELSLHMAFHHFALAEKRDAWYSTGLAQVRRDPAGGAGTSLGGELDFHARWAPSRQIEFMAGFGRFFPGSFVTRTGPSNAATWVFCQTALSW